MATVIRANSFLQRLVGAAALDSAIYEEVEQDPGATAQAMGVVVLASIAMGIGARGLGGDWSVIAVFGTIALVTWAAWAVLMFELGARLLPGRRTRSSVGELLRTVGFAATPGLIAVLASVSAVTIPIFVGSWAWMIAAMVVAVRQALDYESTGKAIAVCLLGWALAMAIAIGLGMIFGPTVY
jgi:hypothetical protein